jgi:beta-glucanase (GH16 family)
MSNTNRNLRLQALLVAVVLVASACGSDSSGDEATTSTTAVTTRTTVAPTTTTTLPPTTTTTIATPEAIPIELPEGYELVWSDEFDGDTINLENWMYDIGGWGWGNGEQQYYTDRRENARLQNGLLVIEGRFERVEDNYYTSARLKTEDLQEFQYGYFEARIKVPEGAGMWPAFWMLGSSFERNEANPIEANWPEAGEIDIMEYVGKEPDLIYGTLHGPGYAGATGLGQRYKYEDVADDFHTYAIEWDFEGIRWFFDGEQYGEKTRDIVGDRWVFDQPFFFLLNLALGGTFPGPIGLDVEFPKYMYVDYVRVYQPIAEASG